MWNISTATADVEVWKCDRMGKAAKVSDDQYYTASESDSESSVEDSNQEGEDRPGFESGRVGEKWMTHYSSSHRILLVGEGDFSFSVCLARAFGSATNMVATSLDNQDCLTRKYSCGVRNVRELEERGCLVLYGVDATKMSDHFFLKTQRFDRIVYNFPHVGFLYRENSYCQIQLNKNLIKGFLRNAKSLLKENGEVHVSHKEGDPYDKWELEKKAKKIGLVVKDIVAFSKDDYPGYVNKRAHGSQSDAPFPLGECNTYKFKLCTNL